MHSMNMIREGVSSIISDLCLISGVRKLALFMAELRFQAPWKLKVAE